MEKVILHSDANCFYANIEMKDNDSLRDVPMVVGGREDSRHGIVLAKNDIAKKFQIVTGEPLMSARKKCPDLVTVPARFEVYTRYSEMLWELYQRYTDQVESYGPDECWLDVTHSTHLFGGGPRIADAIRGRVRGELGITVSVGVSYNKIFAKLGSELKKPDATSVVTRENYKQVLWPLPVSELLYVGASTAKRLNKCNIRTIGQLARMNPEVLRGLFGKWGYVLWVFANGGDPAPVAKFNAKPRIKSIGNSSTTPHDLRTEQDVKITLYLMAESVAARLRESNCLCRTVQIYIRGNDLSSYERQGPLPWPCQDSETLFETAWALYGRNKNHKPIRTLGVRASGLISDAVSQLSFLEQAESARKREQADRAVDAIRKRYGHFSVKRCVMLTDKRLAGLNPKEENVIFPVSYFR